MRFKDRLKDEITQFEMYFDCLPRNYSCVFELAV